MLAALLERRPDVPVMLERDEGFLGLASLEAELAAIDAVCRDATLNHEELPRVG